MHSPRSQILNKTEGMKNNGTLLGIKCNIKMTRWGKGKNNTPLKSPLKVPESFVLALAQIIFHP